MENGKFNIGILMFISENGEWTLNYLLFFENGEQCLRANVTFENGEQKITNINFSTQIENGEQESA